jgi:hypothetical protein
MMLNLLVLTMSSLGYIADTSIPRSNDDFESHLIRLKEDSLTHKYMIDWLASEGITTSLRILERRLRLWGARSKTRVEISDELAERVNYHFHHSLLSDAQIAAKIAEEDRIESSAHQVQVIRRLFGWQRRHNAAKRATKQTATQSIIQDLLYTGPGRSYGRRWAATYLRHRFVHCECRPQSCPTGYIPKAMMKLRGENEEQNEEMSSDNSESKDKINKPLNVRKKRNSYKEVTQYKYNGVKRKPKDKRV